MNPDDFILLSDWVPETTDFCSVCNNRAIGCVDFSKSEFVVRCLNEKCFSCVSGSSPFEAITRWNKKQRGIEV